MIPDSGENLAKAQASKLPARATSTLPEPPAAKHFGGFSVSLPDSFESTKQSSTTTESSASQSRKTTAIAMLASSALSDKQLLDCFYQLYEAIPSQNIRQLIDQIKKKEEHSTKVLKDAIKILQSAEKPRALAKRDATIKYFCELQILSTQTRLQLKKQVGHDENHQKTTAHCQAAITQNREYSRGFILFYIAETLLYQHSKSMERDIAIEHCLKEASDSEVGPSCWRLACNNCFTKSLKRIFIIR